MHKLKTTQWVIGKRLKMFLHLKIRSSDKNLLRKCTIICFILRCLSSIYFEKANLFQGGRGRWTETGNWFKWKQMKLSYISVIWNQDPQILKAMYLIKKSKRSLKVFFWISYPQNFLNTRILMVTHFNQSWSLWWVTLKCDKMSPKQIPCKFPFSVQIYLMSAH